MHDELCPVGGHLVAPVFPIKVEGPPGLWYHIRQLGQSPLEPDRGQGSLPALARPLLEPFQGPLGRRAVPVNKRVPLIIERKDSNS